MQAEVAGLRRFGAAALDLAWVAAGRLDGYWERDIKPWDMAAGIILVREAGGFVTDCDGGDDMLAKGHIVAGNEAIQKDIAARAQARRQARNRVSLTQFQLNRRFRFLRFRHDCFLVVTRSVPYCADTASARHALTHQPMAKDLDPLKLSSPRIFLFRMLVFVVLGGLVAFLLHKQIEVAFMANPGLNALIIGVLLIGIMLSFRQVMRLYPEIAWVNNFRLADPGLAVERAAGAAGADGGDPRQPRRPHGDVGANDARHSRLRSPPASTRRATSRAT